MSELEIFSVDDPTEEIFALPQDSPEKKIWRAVLTQALEDIGVFLRTEKRTSSYYDWIDAVEWIMSDPSPEMGSFESITNILDIDGSEILKMVRSYRCPCCNVKVIHQPCVKVKIPSKLEIAAYYAGKVAMLQASSNDYKVKYQEVVKVIAEEFLDGDPSRKD